MLGGYPQISLTDLRGSRSFLAKLRRGGGQGRDGTFTPASRRRLKRAVDCGAGIGRVTDGLLRHVCERVDVVEPVGNFAEVVGGQSRAAAEGRVGRVFVCGLGEWDPRVPGVCAVAGDADTSADADAEGDRQGEGGNYDLIWNQWCLGHLKDAELSDYLRRCGEAVRRGTTEEEEAGGSGGGWIVVKENMSTDPDGRDIYDEVDSNVTRTDAKFRSLFEEAGLVVVRSELQTGFPKVLGLYPVRMYGLKPKEEKRKVVAVAVDTDADADADAG
jgi:protein N-terminal methyltransferase